MRALVAIRSWSNGSGYLQRMSADFRSMRFAGGALSADAVDYDGEALKRAKENGGSTISKVTD